jgi:hypothetical protein
MSLFAGSAAGPAFIPSVAAFGASLQHDWEFDGASAPFTDSVGGVDFNLDSGSITTQVTNSEGETGVEIAGDSNSWLQIASQLTASTDQMRVSIFGMQVSTLDAYRLIDRMGKIGTDSSASKWELFVTDDAGNSGSKYRPSFVNFTSGTAIDVRLTYTSSNSALTFETKLSSSSTWDTILDKVDSGFTDGTNVKIDKLVIPKRISGINTPTIYERIKVYYN